MFLEAVQKGKHGKRVNFTHKLYLHPMHIVVGVFVSKILCGGSIEHTVCVHYFVSNTRLSMIVCLNINFVTYIVMGYSLLIIVILLIIN